MLSVCVVAGAGSAGLSSARQIPSKATITNNTRILTFINFLSVNYGSYFEMSRRHVLAIHYVSVLLDERGRFAG